MAVGFLRKIGFKGGKMNVADLRSLLYKNEGLCWERIQELRRLDIPSAFREVNVDSREHAIRRGVETVHRALRQYVSWGLDFNSFEPGHGVGHIVRDYINSLRLLSRLEADPREIFIGFVAGVMHDFSCGFFDRYSESGHAVRHAEAGAILAMELAESGELGLNAAETELVAYGIAAHTHYLREATVKCSDGVERKILPYRDTDPNGKPYLCVWIPRWVDRLDCSGPALVARHFLTLGEEHEDYAHEQGFFRVRFADHMRPILRTREEQKAAGGEQTMLEHLRMFASSQTNDSPYGKFDFGRMVELRDVEREMLFKIIYAVATPLLPSNLLHDGEIESIIEGWELFLAKIEPTQMGASVAKELCSNFRKLDRRIQRSWCHGFIEAVKQYNALSSLVLEDIDKIPKECLSLLPITDNLRKFIQPAF